MQWEKNTRTSHIGSHIAFTTHWWAPKFPQFFSVSHLSVLWDASFLFDIIIKQEKECPLLIYKVGCGTFESSQQEAKCWWHFPLASLKVCIGCGVSAMGRQPCCDKLGVKKGPWTAEEDKKLINFILTNGQCCWRAVPKLAGLRRCGKSCRLRWTNYLRPDLKRGLLTQAEEQLVIDLHARLGNRLLIFFLFSLPHLQPPSFHDIYVTQVTTFSEEVLITCHNHIMCFTLVSPSNNFKVLLITCIYVQGTYIWNLF